MPPVLNAPKNPLMVAESETEPPGTMLREERLVVVVVLVLLTINCSEPQTLDDATLFASPL